MELLGTSEMCHGICIAHPPPRPPQHDEMTNTGNNRLGNSNASCNPSLTPSMDSSVEGKSSAGGRKRARTSSVWDYFKKKDMGGTVRYMCNVKHCNPHFIIRSSMSTLHGHLKDHDFLVDDRQSYFIKAGSLSDEWIKPRWVQQWDFLSSLCQLIVNAGLPFVKMKNKYFQEMIACYDHQLTVPCRTTLSWEVKGMQKSHELSMRDAMKEIPGMVSLTNDTWSSGVYKGYLSPAMHWVDRDWIFLHVLLDFQWSPTPHNGETASTLLFELFSK